MSDRNGQDNNIDELLKRLNKMYGADPAGGKPSEKKQKETGSGEMDPELRRMLEQAITDGTPETKQAPCRPRPGSRSAGDEAAGSGSAENQPGGTRGASDPCGHPETARRSRGGGRGLDKGIRGGESRGCGIPHGCGETR